ncbi:MAG: NifU family protein [Methylacidiphilales bacterium]|nr:NifU family protein [Candidatus Methylacidiphilales bacterium]
MSNNNGSSAPHDLAREGQRVQQLVEKIEALRDPAARAMLQECLESVLGFYGRGLERILELVDQAGPEGDKVRDSLIHDPGVRGLLLIHGLHPLPLEDRLREALDQVRPYMESHGGNVELLSLENDFATLRLQGHCKTCPSSAVTLELAVRAAIEEACPDLAGFEVEGFKNGAWNGSEPFEHTPAAAPEWTRIESVGDLSNGGFTSIHTESEPLLICKVNDQLYAYRDHCPACNLPLHLGELKDGLMICSLGHRFDVKRAGASPDNASLHLDPLPLLTQEGVVKVARPRETIHPSHAESTHS